MSSNESLQTDIYHDERIDASLSQTPTTRGHTSIFLRPDPGRDDQVLFSLAKEDFVETLLSVQKVARQLETFYKVGRCALITTGSKSLSILPLHGLSKEWEPVTNDTKEFNQWYPGYISSKDGPQMDSGALDDLCMKIRLQSKNKQPISHYFNGEDTDQNLFARIVRGELQQWRIWEDESHVAVLTPFPNTPGFTVLVPRKHLSSDVFSLGTEDYRKLMRAAHTVAKYLKRTFGAADCGMIFEGFEIDYTHVKLIPIVRSPSGTQSQFTNLEAPFEEKYQGSISSLNGPPVEDTKDIASDAGALRQLFSC